MFHLLFVYYNLSSVWVAEGPLLGKKLLTRLAICSHCLLSICIFHLFSFLVLRAGLAFDCSSSCTFLLPRCVIKDLNFEKLKIGQKLTFLWPK